MDISTRHWHSVAETITPNNSPIQTSFHQIKLLEGESQALCGVMSEAVILPNPSGKEFVYLRSQQGAHLAIQSALTVLDKLSLRSDFTDIFAKQFVPSLMQHWQTAVFKHFYSTPLTEKEQKQAHQSHLPFDIKTFADHPDILLNLYDCSLSVAVLHEDQLLLIQIGRGHAYLLNEDSEVKHLCNQVNIKSSKHLQPLLASPIAHRQWKCQSFSLADLNTEMIMLASNYYHITEQALRPKNHLVTFSRQFDTNGVTAAQTTLKQQLTQLSHNHYSTSLLLIKRRRQWHDGLSRALGREVAYLEDTIQSQNQSIQALQSELATLKENVSTQEQKTSQLINKQKVKPKKSRHSAQLAGLTLFSLLSAVALGVYQHTLQPSSNLIEQAALSPENEALPLKDHGQPKHTIQPLSLSQLTQHSVPYNLATEQLLQYNYLPLNKEEQCIDDPLLATGAAYRDAIDTETKPKVIKPIQPSFASKIKQSHTPNASPQSTAKSNNKPVPSPQPKQAQVKEKQNLQNERRNLLVQKLIFSSTRFGNSALLLEKKRHESIILDQMIQTTQATHYVQQKQRLTKRITRIQHQLKQASRQYKSDLRQLCAIKKGNKLSKLPQQTKMERFAFQQLKQHLRLCNQQKQLTDTVILRTLNQSYHAILAQYK